MAQDIRALIQQRQQALDQLISINASIAEAVCEALRPIIPDIDYTLGWEEVGPDTICLRSESRHVWYPEEEGYRDLGSVVWDALYEAGLPHFIDVPFSFYLTPQEVSHVREVLKKLLVG